jgi:4-amino-4-deoxy-L-arabinose transferase-like glycosyltransferase
MTARRSLREAGAVFVLALALRLAVVAWASSRIPPTADGTFYQTIAERIANGHGYTWLWPDGVVTYAAHYPVGYPALLGGAYALFGASPAVGMTLNALLGSLAALAVHRILARHGRAALWGGLLVALHPGLVAYTPALMTEGVAGALVVLATWSASASRRTTHRTAWLTRCLTGLALGLATLVRPQLIVVAPILGWAAAPPKTVKRLASCALITAVAFGTCLPWTLRNCDKMGRCALVSVNGGWNLLIGTNPNAHGGWAPIDVPVECREVFDEAGKDRCFEGAARQRIRANPIGWLSLIPGKLRATFDYCGAAGWYLHQANGSAFPESAKFALGLVETAFERIVLIGALLASSARPRGRAGSKRAHRIVRGLSGLGVVLSLSPWGYGAFLALAATLGLQAARKSWAPLPSSTFALVASTLAIHGAFFGGGRYQVPVLALVAAVAALARMPQRTPSRSSASTASQSGSPTTLV